MHMWWAPSALLCVSPLAAGWVTSSQSKYGVQLDMIQDAFNGDAEPIPTDFVGFLWTDPEDPLDDTGLGNSITWAWDPALCDKLMPVFKEDVRDEPCPEREHSTPQPMGRPRMRYACAELFRLDHVCVQL
jgi:hypothetical protein